jgi:hypothetical protein
VVIYLLIVAAALSGVFAGDRASALDARRSQAARESLCPSDLAPAELRRRLEPLGESGRTALLALAESTNATEAVCGIAGLSALGDPRAIPPIVRALRSTDMREQTHLVARSAAFLAGGPDPDLGVAMQGVVEAIGEPAAWEAAGNDAIWLLGEVDHALARDRLLAELSQTTEDARLDAVVDALARQGDPRARDRIAAVGLQATRDRSGNATPEQARRLGAVAFYQLALGSDTMAEGFATLGNIAIRNQADMAAWAVHTLCARAVRRPSERAAIEAHRLALVEQLDQRGIAWQEPRGPFGCAGQSP